MLRWLVFPAGALAFGGLIVLTLPALVVVFNDDFGYLRSMLHTIRHARPWTDDWLEPWAASLSWLAAKVVEASGSVKVATQGVQAATACVSFLASCLLLARRGFPALVCPVLAALGLTFPTVFFKTVEFGALTLALPCLLLCLWLAEKRRWIGFLVVWLVAVASRQSAIAWLALPGTAVLTALLGRQPGGGRVAALPGAVCVVGLACYEWISTAMNRTHAQVVMTGAMWDRLTWASAGPALALAGVTFLLAAGIGGFFVRTMLGGPPLWHPSLQLPGVVMRIVAAGAVICFHAVDPLLVVNLEHPLLSGDEGRVYLGSLFAVSVVGWALGGFRLRKELILPALSCGVLVGLRHPVYDYYLLDVAIIGFFAVGRVERRRGPRGYIGDPDEDRVRWDAVLAAAAVVLGLGWLQFGIVTGTKRMLDEIAAKVTLSENALRAGLIEPSELTATSFGHQAWHLYPYFVRMRREHRESIGELVFYLGSGAVDLVGADEPPGAGVVVGDCTLAADRTEPVVAQGWFRIGWGKVVKLTLNRPAGASSRPARWPIDKVRYRLEPFPLNKAEWRDAIERR
jgi:hypothetical protein